MSDNAKSVSPSGVKKFLIVDDEKLIVEKMIEILSLNEDGIFLEAYDGLEALDVLSMHPDICCVICDVMMPNMNGIQLIERVRELNNTVPFIFFSSCEDDLLVKETVKFGAIDFINKPNYMDVCNSIKMALKTNFYREEFQELSSVIDEMQGLLSDIKD